MNMLSDAELQELLAQKTETRNLDCKASFSWDTADHDAKCELVKDILAFLNTQDGGQIVVGVQNDTLEPIGMTDADFTSFDTTKINDFLHRYTDPQSSSGVQKLTFSGLKFVVINVLEFKDIPIICKKAANSSKDQSRTILKLGGVYIRTQKATSVLVPTSEEMRDLVNRAVLKRSDQLLSTIRTLLKGNPPAEETEIKQYDREIRESREYFSEVFHSDFENHGYWEVIAMPQTYNRENSQHHSSLQILGGIRSSPERLELPPFRQENPVQLCKRATIIHSVQASHRSSSCIPEWAIRVARHVLGKLFRLCERTRQGSELCKRDLHGDRILSVF